MSGNSRSFREFHYKDAHFRIHTSTWDAVTDSIITEREKLESFLLQTPGFREALVFSPMEPRVLDISPESVRRMQQASFLSSLGPMAAVAGTMAQLAAEASRKAGSPESIIENGGDLYLDLDRTSDFPITLGIYSGKKSPFQNLAFKILPEMTPLAICSSSSRMGHSLSFGDCDLVTVFSKDASLADAAATLAGNLVKGSEDMEEVLNRIMNIEGIQGILILRDEQLGALGELPELVKTKAPDWQRLVSRDEASDF